MERFKVFDILHHEYLCMINMSLSENTCLQELFSQFETIEIKIKFFTLHQVKKESTHLSFCVERSNLKTAQKVLKNFFKEEDFHIFPEAGMVAVYGPHFGEKPGIINAMHSSLSSKGVRVLAISTTASTSYFVIPAFEVLRSIDLLKGYFEIPQGKV
jgi:aspartokinase